MRLPLTAKAKAARWGDAGPPVAPGAVSPLSAATERRLNPNRRTVHFPDKRHGGQADWRSPVVPYHGYAASMVGRASLRPAAS